MSLFPKPFTYLRTTRTLVRGVWTPSAAQTLTALGSIQPVSGNDLEVMEPGTLEKGAMKVYTGTLLRTRKEASENRADVVLYDGGCWEVVQVLPYTSGLIPHRKYIVEYQGPA